VKSKYFSRRALVLHLALVAWVAMCLAAAWWQVDEAILGNSLSYLYAIEWPSFAVLGFFGWYSLLNEEKMRAEAQIARQVDDDPEDPAMKAYNDHLAEIATRPKKRLWGH